MPNVIKQISLKKDLFYLYLYVCVSLSVLCLQKLEEDVGSPRVIGSPEPFDMGARN